MYKTICTLAFVLLLSAACSDRNKLADAYGNFEVKDVIISSEANGILSRFNIEEGQLIHKGDTIGIVDTVPLYLKKKQLIAQKKTTSSKLENISAQINVLKEQKKNLMIEKNRLDKLFKDGAATDKQMDDMKGNLMVVDKQIESIKVQNDGVTSELEIYDSQIDQINDQIRRCFIISPMNGTILEKYTEPFEMTTQGKTLYKIADISEMYLRVYVSGSQLPYIKAGQKVDVLIDRDKKTMSHLQGVVSWISEQAEFTPKIIQTKEERVNMVYAVKVLVKNDGTLKSGMPGEINFKDNSN